MTTIENNKHYLIFDVESMGLHGEGFAVGGGVFDKYGTRLNAFLFACPTEGIEADKEDKDWVNDNVPVFEITHRSPKQVRDAFWEVYEENKKLFPDLLLVAECPWPVETNFLSACIKDDPTRKWEGPYPLIDLASMMFAVGMDPMEPLERNEYELPVHNPQADAYLTARVFNDIIS